MVGSFSSSLAFDDFAALKGVFLANHLGDGLFVLTDVPLQLGESVEDAGAQSKGVFLGVGQASDQRPLAAFLGDVDELLDAEEADALVVVLEVAREQFVHLGVVDLGQVGEDLLLLGRVALVAGGVLFEQRVEDVPLLGLVRDILDDAQRPGDERASARASK